MRLPSELTLQLGHTSAFEPAALHSARALVGSAFDDWTDEDWDHALGGVHALAWRGAELVGHAAVVQRRLLHQDRAWRAGYVEAVAVHPDWRRRGVGGELMGALERVIERSYEVGALSASDVGAAFYEQRQWARWRGPTGVLSPAGLVRTPDEDGGVFVWPVAPGLALDGPLVCDWRDGDPW
ncbi:MAG: GNAT family N-acetyltransferase [Myxococcota bacterium]